MMALVCALIGHKTRAIRVRDVDLSRVGGYMDIGETSLDGREIRFGKGARCGRCRAIVTYGEWSAWVAKTQAGLAAERARVVRGRR